MLLSGVRVLDLGSFITAPLAAMMLGDFGADVIKVERPEGDPFRKAGGTHYGATFLAFNRNKRSVVLDFGQKADREALLKLVESADVLIDNYRSAALVKLGLAPEIIMARNARLIHCSITGFGAEGPYSERPAFDSVGQALSGIASMLVDPENPRAFGPTISDNVTGMYAAYAVLGALYEREKTGIGRRLEVNMLESSMAFIQDMFTNYTRSGLPGDRFQRIMRSQCFAFPCADGAMLMVHLSTTEKFWLEFVAAIGAAHLAEDVRFRTHALRVKHYDALSDILSAIMRGRPRQHWVERFEQGDIPFAPVQTIGEVVDDPQVAALGALAHMHHPVEGEIIGVACPVRVDGARPHENMSPPPMLGEHTDAVLAEIGVRGDRIA
ncbi:MAG: CoA transferase [Beijerinckiaceae bacterium]|nr:CoA transferase [Beijerinckiaceae bacterium]